MYYEINVTYNHMHLFATSERSLRTLEDAKHLFILLCAKFPEPEYEITVSRWCGEVSGTQLSWKKPVTKFDV